MAGKIRQQVNLNQVIVFSNTITPRLQYILDFIGKETIGAKFQITADALAFREYDGPKINYGNEAIDEREFRIGKVALLFETGIARQSIQCFERNGYKAFFKTEGDFPFDIFAASFYLLSRYEEYLLHEKDQYGRYAHQNSLAFKEMFLDRPVINDWLEDFKGTLEKKFPRLQPRRPQFQFIPTYDIDEAYAFKHKQWWRTIGGFAKSIVSGRWSMIGERTNVLLGKEMDPYDSFDWMDRINKEFNLGAIYFFLVAVRTRGVDKNILPSKRAMQTLVQDISNHYPVGIHPSWQSGDDPEKLRIEFLKFGHITGKRIVRSRQHYIRFTLPGTYRTLIDLGIEADFSMGYGSINGFRASVATPFYWYDLDREVQTGLLLYPFCFMEATSFYEQKFSSQQAFEELKHYYNVVKSMNGVLITIWHNNFFGRGKLVSGWKEIYEQFVSLVKS